MARDSLNKPIILEDNHVDAEILRQFKGDNPAEKTQTLAKDMAEQMQMLYQQWTVALNMVAGNQWLRYDPRTKAIDRYSDIIDRRRPDIVRAVVNRLLPAHDQKLGRMLSVLHIPEVIPQALRADMFNLAEMQTQYLQALWSLRRMSEMDADMKSYCVDLGLGWFKLTWNAKDNLPDFDVLSPYEMMVVPFGVRAAAKASSLIETQAVAFDELRTRYPKVTKDLKYEEVMKEEDYQLLASTDSFIMHQGEYREIKGMVPLRCRTVRPSEQYPKGAVIISLFDRLCELKPIDHPDLWPNYYQFKYRYFAGAMYVPGLIHPNVTAQVLYNKQVSDIISNTNSQARARLMIPESCGKSVQDFDDAGTPLEYEDNPEFPEGQRPWWLAPNAMSSDTYRAPQIIKENMDDALQLHDASRGASVPGVRSDVQLNSMQARDEVGTSPMLEAMGRQYERIFEDCLVMTARNRKGQPIALPGIDPRLASPFTEAEFGEDTSRASFRVKVRTVSRAPWDKAANQEKNIQLLRFKALDDLSPAAKRKVFQQDVDASMFGPEQADRVAAMEENRRILSGDPDVNVNFWDNHPVHIEEHRRECMSLRFRLSKIEIKTAMATHYRAHEGEMATAIQGQVAAQQPPPQPGA